MCKVGSDRATQLSARLYKGAPRGALTTTEEGVSDPTPNTQVRKVGWHDKGNTFTELQDRTAGQPSKCKLHELGM